MLCDVCNALNLTPDNFIKSADDDPGVFGRYHDIGTLKFIKQKKSECALCRLVVEAVGGSQASPWPQGEDVVCRIFWQDDGFVWYPQEPQVRCLRISAQPWPPGFNELNRLMVLTNNELSSQERLFTGRRIKESHMDVKHVKKWVKCCTRWHGEFCDQITVSSSWVYPANFRLIDTWTRCVVPAPTDCKYLVLSYVWGSVDVFKLTQANLMLLQTSGGLTKVWSILPKTIRDTITVTLVLSFRYIWIDSLCIIQDSRSDKQTLIPCMHLIYERAFMSIKAASGRDAEAGLPGVDRSANLRAQTVEEVLPNFRLICPKHLSDALNESVYGSRAWTWVLRPLSTAYSY